MLYKKIVLTPAAVMDKKVVRLSDASALDSSKVAMGDFNYLASCVTLSREGASVSFVLDIPEGGDVLLELEELHRRDDRAIAYKVFLNDNILYFRTYEPSCDSPCGFFVKIPEGVSGRAVIRVENSISEPVRISRLFVYTEASKMFGEFQTKMKLGLFQPPTTWDNYDEDLARLKKIKQDFESYENYKLVFGYDIFYMHQTNEELSERFSHILKLSRETGNEVYIDLNTWWGGTPSGPDGKGGYFGDVEYNQVIWDPEEKKYLLSVPNMWSSTPWYTMNHDYFNTFRKERVKDVMRLLDRLVCEYTKNSPDAPHVNIFIDNEPTYWAHCAYSNSPDSGGDFNASVIAAARRDGVDLVPKGELNIAQREWMLHNLSYYISDLSGAMKQAADIEYGYVSGGKTSLSGHYVAENIYTHIFTGPGLPYNELKHPQFKEHITKNAHLGIECAGYQDKRILDYSYRFGHFGLINSERCCYSDPHFHHDIYAAGSVSDVLFNYWHDIDAGQTRMIDSEIAGLKYIDDTYEYPVFDYQVFTRKMDNSVIVSNNGISVAPMRGMRVMRPTVPGTGDITFCVGKTGDYINGAIIALYALVKPDNGGMRVFAGCDKDNLMLVEDLAERGTDYLSLPKKIDVTGLIDYSKENLYVKIEITSTDFSIDWAQMNYFTNLRVLAKYERDAEIMNSGIFTLKEKRALSTLVAYRADCDRLLGEYGNFGSELFDTLYSSGSYKAAYEHLTQMISLNNTHSFIVEDYGTLGKFPIEVKTDRSGVMITVTPSDDCSFTLKLRGEAGTNVTVRLSGTGVSVQRTGINTYSVSVGENSEQTVVAEPLPKYTGELRVTFRAVHYLPNKIRVSTQDKTVSKLQASFVLNCVPEVPVMLANEFDAGFTAAGLDALHSGDMLVLDMKDDTVVQIKAIRGSVRGTVTTIEPISLTGVMKNAFVTVTLDDGKSIRFEVGRNTGLRFTGAAAGDILCAGFGNMGLSLGKKVLVEYEPARFGARCQRATLIADA